MLKLLFITSCLVTVGQAIFGVPSMGSGSGPKQPVVGMPPMGSGFGPKQPVFGMPFMPSRPTANPAIFNFGRHSINFSKYNGLEAICQAAVLMGGVTDHLSDVMKSAVRYMMRMNPGQDPVRMGAGGANSHKWQCLLREVTNGGMNPRNAANGVSDYFDTAAELPLQQYMPLGVTYNPCEMVFCGEQGMTPINMAMEVARRLRMRRPLDNLGNMVFGKTLASQLHTAMASRPLPGITMPRRQMGGLNTNLGQLLASSGSMGQTNPLASLMGTFGTGQTGSRMGQTTNAMGQTDNNGMGQTTNIMGQTGNNGMGQTPNGMGQTANSMGQTANGMGQTANGMGQTGNNSMGQTGDNSMGQTGASGNGMGPESAPGNTEGQTSASGNGQSPGAVSSNGNGIDILTAVGAGGLNPNGQSGTNPWAQMMGSLGQPSGLNGLLQNSMNTWSRMAASLAGTGNNGATRSGSNPVMNMWQNMLKNVMGGGLNPTGPMDSQATASMIPAANTASTGSNSAADMGGMGTLGKVMSAMIAYDAIQDPPDVRPHPRSLAFGGPRGALASMPSLGMAANTIAANSMGSGSTASTG